MASTYSSAKLEAIRRGRHAAAKQWANEAGLDLLGRAQREAPIDVGELRASGFLTVEELGDTVTATVGFNTRYAAEQHERTDYAHPQGGKAKYLEDPLKEMSGVYQARLKSEVSK